MKELVLAAVLSFAKGPIAEEPAHLRAIAEDITAVVEEEGAPHAFEGPRAREATALLLVAIAAHESGFSHDIDDCRRRGDGGRSRSMWQLIGTLHLAGHAPAEVCANRRLAARLALDVVARTWKKNPLATPQRLLNAYASGSWTLETKASRDICSMWQSRATKLGLAGANCRARGPIGKAPHTPEPTAPENGAPAAGPHAISCRACEVSPDRVASRSSRSSPGSSPAP